jgi:hypothetical protein
MKEAKSEIGSAFLSVSAQSSHFEKALMGLLQARSGLAA